MISGKQLAGCILLIFGVAALLGMLGLNVGGLVSLIIGALLVYYGFKQWRKDNKAWGGFCLIIGAMFLLGSVPFVLSLLIGGLLVYFGYKWMRQDDAGSNDGGGAGPTRRTSGHLDDPFDEEWERMMRSANP